MKSLVLGYVNFSNSNYDIEKSILLFRLNGKRKIKKIESKSLLLYYFAGNQDEYFYESEQYVLVFSGEPYFQEGFLVFISQFELSEFSQQILKVKGLFTCVVFDKKNNKLKLYNDIYGLYPIFYSVNDTSLVFCNEYQPLLPFLGNSKKLNYESINQYFKYGFVFRSNTFIECIKMFEPRNVIICKDGTIKKLKYDSLGFNFKESEYSEVLKSTFDSLKIAVSRLIANADRKKTKVSLSAGLDTRLIFGLIPENKRKELVFNSFYLDPLNETNDRDVIVAKKIAKHYSLDHEIESFTLLTDKLVPDFFNELRQYRDFSQVTGLLGGELLSGVLFNIFSDNTLYACKRHVKLAQNHPLLKCIKLFLDFDNKKLFNDLNHDKTQGNTLNRYGFFVLTQSFFTTVYNGSEGMWVHPWSQCINYSSPFFDTDFLNNLFNIPNKFIYDNEHKFYFDLFQFLNDELKSFETNSFLGNLETNGFIRMNEGFEQKAEKLKKTNKLFSTYYEQFKKQPFYKKSFEKEEQFEQKVIDFMCWKSYVESL